MPAKYTNDVVIVRVPVVSPDGGAAWRALYEEEAPDAEPVEDDEGAAAHRAQADALEIEAQAKRRLADEYDAAQERGEVSSGRDGPGAGVLHGNAKATVADLGLTRKAIHEARQLRDAEEASPGVIRRTLDERLATGRPLVARLRAEHLAIVTDSPPLGCSGPR